MVREINRPSVNDPMSLSATQADLAILWHASPIGFRHPTLGDIGPAPSRRMGGHSGGLGALYVRSTGVMPGDRGVRSSFDVAPTILDLMGRPCAHPIDGLSVFQGADAAPTLAAAEIALPSEVAASAASVTGIDIVVPEHMEVELTIPTAPLPLPVAATVVPMAAPVVTEIFVMPQPATTEQTESVPPENRTS